MKILCAYSAILLSLSLMFLTSCKTKSEAAGSNKKKTENTETQCENSVAGVLVDKSGLDGCSMVIKIGDNEYLEPANLASFIKTPREGMQIVFSYDEPDFASICMVGTVIRITCMEDYEG